MSSTAQPRERWIRAPRRVRRSLLGRDQITVELAAMLALFAALRVYAVARAPVAFPDTPSYLPLDFLGHQERLWTVPLIYKIFPTDGLREAAQLCLGIAAWSTLAVTLSQTVEHRVVRLVAVLVVLLLGLIPQVTGWDSALLSESISTSLLVLLVALLIRLSRKPTARPLFGCLAIACLWEFARQENALLFIVLTPLVVFAAARWLPGRTAVATSGAILLLAAAGGYEALVADGDRPVVRNNALLIIEYQLAPDPAALRYLIAHGLPVSSELLRERNAFRGGVSSMYQDRRLLSWIDRDWEATYAGYLLRHPLHTLAEPLRQAPAAISSPVSVALREREVLPAPVRDTIWSSTGGEIPFWLAVAVVIMLASLNASRRLRHASVIALLALFALAGAELTWTLSGYPPGPELARQFMPVAVATRLAILLAIVFSLDAIGADRLPRFQAGR